MSVISYGSVCSGIESASVAWEIFGWRPAWFAEIEPAPSAVLAYRFPQVVNLGDMTKIAQYVRLGMVEAPDILVGGTPCQAFSVAGVRAGLNDPRGQLTLAYADLANAIDERRGPGNECVIVWENVPGVLSDKTNAFGCFLALLAGEDTELVAPGGKWPNAGCVVGPKRAIAWRVIDAQYFGVAQRRRRVYLVASARNGFDPARVLFEFEGVRRDIAPSRESGQSVTGTLGARSTGGGGLGTDFEVAGGMQPVVGSLTTRCGEAGQNEVDSNLLLCMAHGQAGAEIAVNMSPTMRAMNHSASHMNGGGQLGVTYPVCVTGDVTHTLKAEGHDASEDGTGRGQPIVATYGLDEEQNGACELMGTLKARAKAGGHQFAVAYPTTDGTRTGRGQPIVATVADTLTANWHKSGGALAGNNPGMLNPVITTVGTRTGQPGPNRGRRASDYAVRRLTPIECERLQGFPDNWTLVPFKGKPLSNSARYKALGNSKAVPCIRWVGARLILTHYQMLYGN